MPANAPKDAHLPTAAEGAQEPGLPHLSGARHHPDIQPPERHLIADDKLVLAPSPRRPRQRDLERLTERWRGWR
jgi:hypothetical protein